MVFTNEIGLKLTLWNCWREDEEEEEEEEEEGAKMFSKIAQNQICISLESKYIYKSKKFVHVKIFMCLKV